MSWLHEQTGELLAQIEEAKANRVFPFFRPFQNVGRRVKVGKSSYLSFTSNDYLGLSQDKRVIARASEGLHRYGTGLGSARPQATSDRHQELERRLADWMGFEAAATFTTGYQGMVGILSAFCDDDTTVVCDKLSHACILDGAFLAQGMNPDLELRFFKHNSAKSLRRILSQTEKPKRMVVVEGLYSVDGDIAPLAELIAVCREFNAVVVVDDAHGIGTIGPTARGACEIQGVLSDVDILFGSFSKSFGGIGGFVLTDRTLIDFLKLKARSFVYSASLPIAQVEAAIAAHEIIVNDHAKYLAKLESNRDFFRQGLLDLGFNLGDSETHITPIMVGDEIKTLTFGAYLYHGAGIIMMPFIYPGVPLGKGRLRCNVTAMHDEADMGYTLEALATIGKELGLLDSSAQTNASRVDKVRYLAEHKLRGVRNAGLGYLGQEVRDAAGKLQAWVKGEEQKAAE
jgi:7-keto-8-aminopelargonate synthetase-like enzyme